MWEFLQTPTAQVIISLAVLAVFVVIGVYVVLRFRGFSDGDEQSIQETFTILMLRVNCLIAKTRDAPITRRVKRMFPIAFY